MRMNPGDKNCGPVALSTATGLEYEDILCRWPGGWKDATDDTGKLGIPNDTPADHFTVISEFGLPYRLVGIEKFLRGECKPGSTVVLLHLVKEPKSWWEKIVNFFKGTFSQHWVVLEDIYFEDQLFSFDWGYNLSDGKKDIRTFDKESTRRMLLAGWPYCVYEIGIAGNKPTWFEKLFARWV